MEKFEELANKILSNIQGIKGTTKESSDSSNNISASLDNIENSIDNIENTLDLIKLRASNIEKKFKLLSKYTN
ncbi:hypothetical protein [Priestia megaterium]|uniref:Uncharacterized protein n=1 Tax=Priestia megaterium TaxID=1404 RepID=A0A6M6E7I8_PRIMG|nr:hypothetical protein [Priestia megaterium]QJX80517.1 hypothetical protein FDZ14_30990 [Priestia megaterium]